MDWISINGTTGEIILGKQPLKPPELAGDLGQFMEWVDKFRTLNVLTNADTPEDAVVARRNGAEGIGLCRTEHMFFATEDRIKSVRKMIVAQVCIGSINYSVHLANIVLFYEPLYVKSCDVPA